MKVGTNLLKLVKVGSALERPHSRHVLRELKWLYWLPIFDHARLVRRYDTVKSIAILEPDWPVNVARCREVLDVPT